MPTSTIIDDLLLEIFIRLPTPEDLARVAIICPSFREVDINDAFTRRFRMIHTPPLLGIIDGAGFNPALPTHPSVLTGSSLAPAFAKDFSFSFPPSPDHLGHEGSPRRPHPTRLGSQGRQGCEVHGHRRVRPPAPAVPPTPTSLKT
ncbi:hypothetical protein D1007_16999 [Hordeum vulgare]|nr:hypothetical protein D1007_16999 [Hordeum vulgare]